MLRLTDLKLPLDHAPEALGAAICVRLRHRGKHRGSRLAGPMN